jgi:hypothetical protein
MKKTIILVSLCLLCGCRSLDHVGWRFTAWRVDRRNTKVNRQYQQAVAKYAGRECLVGTWYHTFRKPCKMPNQWHETVSLFSDGTYAKRISGCHGLFWPTVSVTTGDWKKTGAGIVELSQSGRSVTEVICLTEWTNGFAQADMQLRSAEFMESHNKVPENTVTNATDSQH